MSGYESFYSKIWKTKGCRYVAYNRLLAQNRWSIASISILSLYVIVFSLLGLLFPIQFSGLKNLVLQSLSLIASIFIIIISLLEASKSYELKAEALHRSANQISKMFYDYEFHLKNQTLTPTLFASYSKQYSEIIESCPYNQTNTDFECFQSQHQKDFSLDNGQVIWLKFKYLFKSFGLYLALLTVFPLISFIILMEL